MSHCKHAGDIYSAKLTTSLYNKEHRTKQLQYIMSYRTRTDGHAGDHANYSIYSYIVIYMYASTGEFVSRMNESRRLYYL